MFFPDAIVKLEGSLTVDYAEPHMKFNSKPQVQDVSSDGLPLWDMSCIYSVDGRPSEIVKVRVALQGDPLSYLPRGFVIPKGQGMKASPWVRGNRIQWTLKLSPNAIENILTKSKAK